MKYPITVTVVVLIALAGMVKVAYEIVNREHCDPAESYEFFGVAASDAENLSAATRIFAESRGYKFMHSALEGPLTLYGADDNDRLMVIFNTSKKDGLKVSFYDCRKGGNGTATAGAWMRSIGRRYLTLGAT